MKYFLYCRKSTEADDRQILSLDSQEKEMLDLAKSLNIKIHKIYKESMSAKSPGRPIFEEMLSVIEKTDGVCIFTWNLDRLARNGRDGGTLTWFMDKNLISEIITPGKTLRNTPDDKFMMNLSFGMAKKMVDDLSVNVKRGNKTKLAQGGWPGVAPLGYKNNRANHTIVVDKNRSVYIKEIFRLFATGGYSVRKITEIIYEKGFRSRLGNKVSKSQIYKIIKNPFYAGTMLRLGKLYDGKHKPIISQNTFDTCQDIFNGVSSKYQKHTFLFRGYMTCAVCECALTATKAKGHTYYYCTNGKKNCEQRKKYLRSKDAESIFAKVLNKIKLDLEIIKIMYLANKEKGEDKKNDIEVMLQNIDRELKLLQNKRKRLLDGYMAELMTEDVCKARTDNLDNEEIKLNNQKKQILAKNNNGLSTFEQTKNTFLQAHYAENKFLDSDPLEQRDMLEKLLSNLSIKDNELANFKLKMPYQTFSELDKNASLVEWQGC